MPARLASGVSAREQQSTWREIMSVRSADAYRSADMDLARQLGGLLWLMGAIVVAVLLPLAPPTESSIGSAGWFIAAALIVSSVVLAGRLLRRSDPAVSPTELLLHSVVAVVAAGVLMWLADDPGSYSELLLFSTLYVAAVHPPRRVLGFLVVLALALGMPLLYAEGDSLLAGQVGRFLIWSGLAIVATAFTSRVRFQRAGLLRQGIEARVEARADPLTDLGNRRAFDEAMTAATARARRNGTALSAILIDLDSFKSINDEHGLVAGDRCLRQVADVLRDTVRRPDSCFRWGGDEFVVLADVDRVGAERLAARLGAEVTDLCRRPDGSPVLLHNGTAQFGSDGSDGEDLLASASAALKPVATRPSR